MPERRYIAIWRSWSGEARPHRIDAARELFARFPLALWCETTEAENLPGTELWAPTMCNMHYHDRELTLAGVGCDNGHHKEVAPKGSHKDAS